MSDDASRKVLVKRPTRITTDGHGRSVWADPVDSAELELVSTQMLKVMLTSRDQQDLDAIRAAAASAEDGVLVRNPEIGSFDIISNEELEAILETNDDLPEISRPADATLEPLKDYPDDEKLSLVSSQALRRVLDDEEEAENTDEVEVLFDEGGGFNPYDKT